MRTLAKNLLCSLTTHWPRSLHFLSTTGKATITNQSHHNESKPPQTAREQSNYREQWIKHWPLCVWVHHPSCSLFRSNDQALHERKHSQILIGSRHLVHTHTDTHTHTHIDTHTHRHTCPHIHVLTANMYTAVTWNLSPA